MGRVHRLFICGTQTSPKVCRVAVTPQGRGPLTGSDADSGDLRVAVGGETYPAEEVARGAAYELFSEAHDDGFTRDMRPGSRYPYHRFVHASEVTATSGRSDDQPRGHHAAGPEEPEAPLIIPLSRAIGWSDVHSRTQGPAHAGDPLLVGLRNSAVVRRGTRMVKPLSAGQVGAHLKGRLVQGFCYRQYDIAHLRTPGDLALLQSEARHGPDAEDVAYALRWRAVDGVDYDVPSADRYGGLVAMPAHDRMGSPVLGTGFAPSGRHVIPEFVTANLTDIPMPAGARIVAYTPDGDEIILFAYQPEQRGWLRMAGPRWRHLLAAIPDVSPDQEYVQMAEIATSVRLVGNYRGEECPAVADPPGEFRVLAMTRAARYQVESMVRRNEYGFWREAPCQVLRQESSWLRLRLCRPNPDAVARLGAQCYERGIYEAWAPLSEVTGRQLVDTPYAL